MYQLTMAMRKAFNLNDSVRVCRSGIIWDLQLKEGIDLSIYWLGKFEPGTQKLLLQLAKPGDVVLDVGANIGAHALPLARAVGETGRVIAFEPTDYALEKLRKNCSLNPSLQSILTVEPIMLTAKANDPVPSFVYSSWPMVPRPHLHQKHQGQLNPTHHAHAERLDDYLERQGIRRVNLIKLDVDGFELSVLQGARKMLETSRPLLVMELTTYCQEGASNELETLLQLLKDMRYQLRHPRTKRLLPTQADPLRQLIPDGADLNVIVEPI